MSEKRFHQFGLWVIDNPNFNGISIADLVDTELMSITEVVDLLNEQQATINRLQSDLKDYNEIKENWDDLVELATKTSLRNVELDEQIGQLRKELNDCEKFRYTVFKRMGELNDE